MTVASINSTVTVIVDSELGMGASSSYAPAINAVTTALEAREYDIVDAIVNLATGYAAEEDVRNILEQAGLAVRPVIVPEPEVEDEEAVTADDVESGKLSKGERIAKLEEGQSTIIDTLGSLAEAVKGLKALAERHLGSTL